MSDAMPRRFSRARLVVPAALTVSIVVAASSAMPACGDGETPLDAAETPTDTPVDAPTDARVDAPDANPPFD